MVSVAEAGPADLPRVDRGPRVYIGTSGWHYRHWVGPFYPEGTPPADYLANYAEHFDTVEINNVFYRLPARGVFEGWRERTQQNFIFACKASRFITHFHKLKPPFENYLRFFDAIAGLGEKLGPILFQLPPQWPPDKERLASFLDWLPGNHRYSFEFRHDGWFCEPVFELLHRRNAAFCIYDLAGRQAPCRVTADFVYVRLHGPAGPYQGSYDDAALATWARRVAEWQKKAGCDVFVYFDNDQRGYAAGDGLRLRETLSLFQASADKR